MQAEAVSRPTQIRPGRTTGSRRSSSPRWTIAPVALASPHAARTSWHATKSARQVDPKREAQMTVHSAIARARIPRDKQNDYTAEAAAKRRAFVEEQTGKKLDHIGQYSFSASVLPGNVENFFGVAQVPIGLAGPLASSANMPRAASTFRLRPRKEHSSRATAAACGCCPSAGASRRLSSSNICSGRRYSFGTMP